MEPPAMRSLLREMLRIRVVEETIADLYPQQEMRCPVHLCIGQEAIAVGVCANLTPRDYVLSGHRSHGHYLAKGGDLPSMMAEIYGRASGCASGKGGSMHLIDLAAGYLGSTPIVASTIPIAVGAAFGSKSRGEDRVSVVFFGEGATEEGVFHESVNFAVLHTLPVIFVCENNLYSVYSPMSVRQPESRDLMTLGRGHGVPSERGDGNDVLAVAALAAAAVDRARAGKGPSLLEFATYRWREHCGPYYDNTIGYRTEQEFDLWRQRCPIERLQHRMIDDRSITVDAIVTMRQELTAEMNAAVAFARASEFPDPSSMFQHVHA